MKDRHLSLINLYEKWNILRLVNTSGGIPSKRSRLNDSSSIVFSTTSTVICIEKENQERVFMLCVLVCVHAHVSVWGLLII